MCFTVVKTVRDMGSKGFHQVCLDAISNVSSQIVLESVSMKRLEKRFNGMRLLNIHLKVFRKQRFHEARFK